MLSLEPLEKRQSRLGPSPNQLVLAADPGADPDSDPDSESDSDVESVPPLRRPRRNLPDRGLALPSDDDDDSDVEELGPALLVSFLYYHAHILSRNEWSFDILMLFFTEIVCIWPSNPQMTFFANFNSKVQIRTVKDLILFFNINVEYKILFFLFVHVQKQIKFFSKLSTFFILWINFNAF